MMSKNKILLLLASIASVAIIISLISIERGLLQHNNLNKEAFLSGYHFDRVNQTQWPLPEGLDEVSGIAVLDDERILIHQDEIAAVFEFNITDQSVTRRFQLRDPVLKRDLEGIAVMGDDVYLIDSTSETYRIRGGIDRTGTIDDFDVFDPGLSKVCEIEGLDEDLLSGSLVLVCKQVYEENADYVSVYRFTPASDQTEKLFDISFTSIGQSIQPSAIAVQHGNYVIACAEEKLLIQLLADGSIISIEALNDEYHPLVEGIGFLKDSSLILADEGFEQRGRISIYH